MNNNKCTNISLMLKCFELIDVEHIFFIGGDEDCSVFSSIKSQNSNIELILAGSEISAFAMASSYYEETGSLGVVFSGVDNKAVNVIPVMGAAIEKEVPLLLVTVNENIVDFTETSSDIVGELKYSSKLSTLVSHGDQVGTKIVSAIMSAKSEPCGPVHLNIPSDLLLSRYTKDINVNKATLNKEFALFDASAVDDFCDELDDKTFCLYLGKGCEGSIEKIMAFIESTNTYFVVGEDMKGYVDERHPLYKGVYGPYGHKSAVDLMLSDSVNYVIAVGHCFIPDTKHFQLFKKTINFDFVERIYVDNGGEFRQFVCHLTLLFSYLLGCVATRKFGFKNNALFFDDEHDNKFNKGVSLRGNYSSLKAGNRIDPVMLMGELSKNLPANTRLYVSSKKIIPWVTHYFFSDSAVRVSCFNHNLWAIGAGAGRAIVNSSCPIVCLIDNLQQILTCKSIKLLIKRRIPVVFVCLDFFSTSLLKSIDGYNGLTIGNHRHDTQHDCNSIVIKSSKQLINFDFNSLFFLNKPSLVSVWVEKHIFFKE